MATAVKRFIFERVFKTKPTPTDLLRKHYQRSNGVVLTQEVLLTQLVACLPCCACCAKRFAQQAQQGKQASVARVAR